MQPLKQVLYQIDESGSGRMSYHDFYVSPCIGFLPVLHDTWCARAAYS